MKSDSDSKRDEALCLHSDHLENVCFRGKAVGNDIKFLKVILLYCYYEDNTCSLWKM